MSKRGNRSKIIFVRLFDFITHSCGTITQQLSLFSSSATGREARETDRAASDKRKGEGSLISLCEVLN